jgi:acyl carrier protein
MSSRSDIESDVRQLLTQVLDIPAAQVGPGLDFRTTAAWSSLKHLMLVSQIESRFEVMFSNEEIADLTGYDSIVEAVSRRLVAQG